MFLLIHDSHLPPSLFSHSRRSLQRNHRLRQDLSVVTKMPGKSWETSQFYRCQRIESTKRIRNQSSPVCVRIEKTSEMTEKKGEIFESQTGRHYGVGIPAAGSSGEPQAEEAL